MQGGAGDDGDEKGDEGSRRGGGGRGGSGLLHTLPNILLFPTSSTPLPSPLLPCPPSRLILSSAASF
eukprot:580610-Pyramimonas_sp.AAC.2